MYSKARCVALTALTPFCSSSTARTCSVTSLAAPILRFGLPTLVVLNMADDLRSRGGDVDPAALARELGAPVALISAAKGQGVDKVFQFLEGSTRSVRTSQSRCCSSLSCRTFRNAGSGLRRSALTQPIRLRFRRTGPGGSMAFFCIRCGDPIVFAIVVLAVFQTDLQRRHSTDGTDRDGDYSIGLVHRITSAGWFSQVTDYRRRLERSRSPSWCFCPRSCCCSFSLEYLRTPATCARGPDRRSNHATRRPSRQVVHSSVVGVRVRGTRNSRDAHDRKQARSHSDNSDRAIHDLFGPTARLCTTDRCLPSGSAYSRRFPGDTRNRATRSFILGFLAAFFTAKILKSSVLEKRKKRIRIGDASLPLAHLPIAWLAFA